MQLSFFINKYLVEDTRANLILLTFLFMFLYSFLYARALSITLFSYETVQFDMCSDLQLTNCDQISFYPLETFVIVLS